MQDWNPEQYLLFQQERTRPARDLIARIEMPEPARILDIGCGPGNSTRALLTRWPEADISGIDNSPAMIEQAKSNCPEARFFLMDAGSGLDFPDRFDLVYSNASLQWIPSHENLIPSLYDLVKPGGVFAAQIPQYDRMPAAQVIAEVSSMPAYAPYLAGFDDGMHFFPDRNYYDWLSGKSRRMDLWSTAYFHVMPDHDGIVQMLRSTGIRPYLERLPGALGDDFLDAVKKGFERAYPAQQDGRVLFPFLRYFIAAYKKTG